VILSYASMLMEAPPASQEALRADLSAIDEAARGAVELTSTLLAFGRRQGGRPIPLDLAAWLARNKDELGGILGDDIALTVDAEPGEAKLDPTLAGRMFRELIENAREAMPSGGTVSIKVRPVALDDAFVASHPGATTGHHLQVELSDTGSGMTPEVRARLFEPFFTTKGRGKGQGLGLALVYGVIRQSGGTIWVETAPDQGTTFTLYLLRA
jgi:signal transduction histidine kinase